MPIIPPDLDDRGFEDLVDELVRRIPAHTPEWTHVRPGDPGRTLIELFAWLGDTILYRLNRIPERQRLAFLRLLGHPLRAAVPAEGLVVLGLHADDAVGPVLLDARQEIVGPRPFETADPVVVWPVHARVFQRRLPSEAERTGAQGLATEVERVFAATVGVGGVARRKGVVPTAYFPTELFAEGPAEAGWRPRDAVDRSLWVALCAAEPELVTAVRAGMGGGGDVDQPILNLALRLDQEIAEPLTPALQQRLGVDVEWSATTGRDDVPYVVLDQIVADSTQRLTRSGVVRLGLPRGAVLGAPAATPSEADPFAGFGDRPPRVDDPELAARIVTWIRMRPRRDANTLSISWVGVNAVRVVQWRSRAALVVGASDGSADQEFALPEGSVDPATFKLDVEDDQKRWVEASRVDDLSGSKPDQFAFVLDAEAGTLRFGDGVHGRVPASGSRVRVRRARFGGGVAGNLPAGSLSRIAQRDLVVAQPLPTRGGVDAETLASAERRIPATLRHHSRAVTAEDYRELAHEVPGAGVGRVEVLPRFLPASRLDGVAGVVSVMVWPRQPGSQAPAPRADRAFLHRVHDWLDRRRPLGTELFTIGCEYVPLGLGVGLEVADGADPNQVALAVRTELQQWLWALPPHGPRGDGWQLGETVDARHLEVVVARTAGVAAVRGVELFRVVELSAADAEASDLPRRTWKRVPPSGGTARLTLQSWQLPELLEVVVGVDQDPPDSLARLPGLPGGFGGEEGDDSYAIPVVPEVC